MNQHKAKKSNPISSTPVTRPARESLARINKNSVSEMVNRFTQIIESTNGIPDRMPAVGPIGRQVSFCSYMSAINEASQLSVDTKMNFADSGYESFRRRSKSVNVSSFENGHHSKTLLGRYEQYPNFKFRYLTYFGVDPTKYLSKFDIDYDPVSDSICHDSSVREAGGSATKNSGFNVRDRSMTFSSKRTSDLNSGTVSSSKYAAVESPQRNNKPMKMGVAVKRDFENIFPAKMVASNDDLMKKSFQSTGTQTDDLELESLNSDVGKFLLRKRRKKFVFKIIHFDFQLRYAANPVWLFRQKLRSIVTSNRVSTNRFNRTISLNICVVVFGKSSSLDILSVLP